MLKAGERHVVVSFAMVFKGVSAAKCKKRSHWQIHDYVNPNHGNLSRTGTIAFNLECPDERFFDLNAFGSRQSGRYILLEFSNVCI